MSNSTMKTQLWKTRTWSDFTVRSQHFPKRFTQESTDKQAPPKYGKKEAK